MRQCASTDRVLLVFRYFHAVVDAYVIAPRYTETVYLSKDVQVSAGPYLFHFDEVSKCRLVERGIVFDRVSPHEDHDGPLSVVFCLRSNLTLCHNFTLGAHAGNDN